MATRRPRTAGPHDEPPVNEVRLVGRVSAIDAPKELPSGDLLVVLRLVVPRPAGRAGARVDAIDVTCWSARTRRAAGRVKVGDTVGVAGALRRRFFRSAGGAVSRYEVEADSLAKVAGAG